MRGEKDLWHLIFFLSDISSKESETEIFIAVYVSDFFFPSKRDHAIFGYHWVKKLSTDRKYLVLNYGYLYIIYHKENTFMMAYQPLSSYGNYRTAMKMKALPTSVNNLIFLFRWGKKSNLAKQTAWNFICVIFLLKLHDTTNFVKNSVRNFNFVVWSMNRNSRNSFPKEKYPNYISHPKFSSPWKTEHQNWKSS